MATPNETPRARPVAIAPAPANAPAPIAASTPDNPGERSPPRFMPYTCQTCARRKVKCDRTVPICSTCRKGKLECVYQAPPPRRKKRKLSDDVLEKLAHYEKILRQHNLLDGVGDAGKDEPPPSVRNGTPGSFSGDRQEERVSLRLSDAGMSEVGKLVIGHGKTRYIDNNVWRNFGNEEVMPVSDDEELEEDHRQDIDTVAKSMTDPLTEVFLGLSQTSLYSFHLAQSQAMVLWATHVESVEPLCKILHIPSATGMVERASQHPDRVSKSDECLLFAVYHFAIFSMTERECIERLHLSTSESRATLLQRFNYATRQALANASFLKTTEMTVLQALVIFLLSCRNNFYDAHTYWILTGVAVRIAQRMGLHRDGEKLGLPPFDVHMRRRLFYQLLPLDGVASQMSGTGITMVPDTWDTQPPQNIDDNQIWPGMTEMPEEKQGATEMIFCLSRACLGKYAAGAMAAKRDSATSCSKTSSSFFASSPNSGLFHSHEEAEQMISQAEREVEEKFLRYCDVVDPLHFLTMCSARSGVTAMRIKIRLPRVMDKNRVPSDAERREVFQLTQKVLDTDAAACAHSGLQRFRWHVRYFFLWGTWDSLIFVLTSLCRKVSDNDSPLLSVAETMAAWKSVEQLYHNHEELLVSKRALYVALGRLTVKAWTINQSILCTANANDDGHGPVKEPDFVTALRRLWERPCPVQRVKTFAQKENDLLGVSSDPSPATGTGGSTEVVASFFEVIGDGSFLAGMDLDFVHQSADFDIEAADWMFWDQLIKDHRVEDE